MPEFLLQQQGNHIICCTSALFDHSQGCQLSGLVNTVVMLQGSVTSTQICHAPSHLDRQRKPFSVAGCRKSVVCQAQQTDSISHGRRAMAAMLSTVPLMLVAQKGAVFKK